MSVYTVVSASKKKDVPDGKYGPMQVLALSLLHGDNNSQLQTSAEWYTKASTPIPASGTRLEGELEQSDYGWKFKKAQAVGGNPNFGPRPEDPARAKRIVRQHSQDMSIATLTLSSGLGVWPEHGTVNSVADVVAAVKKLADVYDKDANA